MAPMSRSGLNMNELKELKKIEWLKERLLQPLPGFEGQERMAARVRPMPSQIPDNARYSAVLCLLFPVEYELNVLLIKRKEDGKAHSGQIGFPGGKQEPEDADMLVTAQREATEEVGILPGDYNVLGALTPLYIPVSNFKVFPYVAFAERRLPYTADQNEVAEILEVPVDKLFHADNKITTDVTSPAMPGKLRNVKAYQVPGEKIIWGATAMILSELETVLEDYIL